MSTEKLYDAAESLANRLSEQIEKAETLASEIQDKYFSKGVTLESPGRFWELALEYKHFSRMNDLLLDVLGQTRSTRLALLRVVELLPSTSPGGSCKPTSP